MAYRFPPLDFGKVKTYPLAERHSVPRRQADHPSHCLPGVSLDFAEPKKGVKAEAAPRRPGG